MTTGNLWERAFRRLLALEAGPTADAPAVAAAAGRLCERFEQQVTPLIGDAGAAAICARSLHLAQRQFPWLGSVGASEQSDGPFARVRQSLEQQEPVVATEAAVAVLAAIGELLAAFIGESLTTRLLREAWPDEFSGDTTEETSR